MQLRSLKTTVQYKVREAYVSPKLSGFPYFFILTLASALCQQNEFMQLRAGSISSSLFEISWRHAAVPVTHQSR